MGPTEPLRVQTHGTLGPHQHLLIFIRIYCFLHEKIRTTTEHCDHSQSKMADPTDHWGAYSREPEILMTFSCEMRKKKGAHLTGNNIFYYPTLTLQKLQKF